MPNKDKNRTVLIIDDDEQNVFALTSYLEGKRLKVLSAKSGNEGIALVEENKIDLILLDLVMPELDGFGVLKILREKKILEKIPVIMVTAKAMKGDREKSLEAGAWDYVSKPVDLKSLMSKVTRLIA